MTGQEFKYLDWSQKVFLNILLQLYSTMQVLGGGGTFSFLSEGWLIFSKDAIFPTFSSFSLSMMGSSSSFCFSGLLISARVWGVMGGGGSFLRGLVLELAGGMTVNLLLLLVDFESSPLTLSFCSSLKRKEIRWKLSWYFIWAILSTQNPSESTSNLQGRPSFWKVDNKRERLLRIQQAVEGALQIFQGRKQPGYILSRRCRQVTPLPNCPIQLIFGSDGGCVWLIQRRSWVLVGLPWLCRLFMLVILYSNYRQVLAVQES